MTRFSDHPISRSPDPPISLLQPLLELFIADHARHCSHAVMPEAAELRAGHLIISNLQRLEMGMDVHSRYSIMLEAHSWNKEAVNHVLSPQGQFHFTVHRQHQRT